MKPIYSLLEKLAMKYKDNDNTLNKIDKAINLLVRESKEEEAMKILEDISNGNDSNIDTSLIAGDTDIIYARDWLKQPSELSNYSLADILKDIGYADSTIRTTIRKFKISSDVDSYDNIIHTLKEISNSRSKYKKGALAKLEVLA